MTHTQRPSVLFWCFAIVYCLLWTILATTFQTNFRSDIIEQYFLGGQWVSSSAKHPMISAWYLNLIRFLTGNATFAPYLAVESLVLVMLWSIWSLARRIFKDDPHGEVLALLTVLASACFRYLNIGNLVYNHNTAVALCWTLAILFFYRALTDDTLRKNCLASEFDPGNMGGGGNMKKRSNKVLTPWLWTGFWLGLGFHAKYIIAFLVFTMLCFMVINRHARHYWKTPGPYLTIIIAVLVFLPHFVWLAMNDFPTLRYAAAAGTRGHAEWYSHLIFPIKFFLATFLVLLPAFIALIPLLGWFWNWTLDEALSADEKMKRRFQVWFLSSMVGIPLALHLTAALFGRNQPTSYAMPLGMYCPLLVLVLFRRNVNPISVRRTASLSIGILALTMLVWATTVTLDARYGKRPSPTDFPGRELAAEVESIWKERFGNVPCPFVTDLDTYGLSGNVYAYGKQKIRVHHRGVTLQSTDYDMNRFGGIVLWDARKNSQGTDIVQERFPNAEILPELVLTYRKPLNAKFQPEQIGIALIPPPRQD